MTENDLPAPPVFFAGRQPLYTRLRQYILNPGGHALTITGQAGIGKTAFLHQFPRMFDNHFIGVYVPVARLRLDNEHTWLKTLMNTTNTALIAAGFESFRLPQPPDSGAGSLREWLKHAYLPEIFHIIRPQRRLVWLLDDIGYFISAVTERHLPEDSPSFLLSLMQTCPQLSIVLTARTDYEHRLSALTPLYHPAIVQRMEQLSAEESRELLQAAAPGLSDADARLVYEAGGGSPRLLQRFARRLSDLPQDSLAPDDVKWIADSVYAESAAEFQALWRTLNRDERLVLTGVSGLLYENAGQVISAGAISRWLGQNDYPMDIIAVNAALRSLEYHHILAGSAQGVRPVSGLMQTWLLENARLDDNRMRSGYTVSRRRLLLLALLSGILILVTLTLLSQVFPAERSSSLPVPTVTLSQ